MNRNSCLLNQCSNYALRITSRCDANGRVMGIAWSVSRPFIGRFFVMRFYLKTMDWLSACLWPWLPNWNEFDEYIFLKIFAVSKLLRINPSANCLIGLFIMLCWFCFYNLISTVLNRDTYKSSCYFCYSTIVLLGDSCDSINKRYRQFWIYPGFAGGYARNSVK